MSSVEPSANGSNGHGPDGKFLQGNPGGPGNPHAAEVSQLRSALLQAVTADDLRNVIAALVNQAKSGNVQAAKVLLDRLFGRPKLEVELSGDSQLSMEQRVSIVNRFFGIEPGDENLQFGTKKR